MGVLDDVGDLIHKAYDTVTGKSSVSTPDKPEATSAPASDWVSRQQAKAQAGSNQRIDDAVREAGG